MEQALYDKNDFYDAMVSKIDDRISFLERTQEKEKNILKEIKSKQTPGLKSKLEIASIESGIKNRKNSISEMQALKGLLYKISFQSFNYISNQTQVSLGNILKYLDEKEGKIFKEKINDCINKSTGNVIEIINKNYLEALKITKKVFGTSKLFVQHRDNYKSSFETTFVKAFDTFVKRKLNEAPRINLGPIVKEIKSNVKDFESDLNLLIKDPSLNGSKIVMNIEKNYDRLVELKSKHENAQKALSAITLTISQLDGRVFGDLIKFLHEKMRSQQLIIKNTNTEINKIVNQDHLKDFINRARENKRLKEQGNAYEKMMRERYSSLAYELEKLRSTNGREDVIAKIERQMSDMRKDDSLYLVEAGLKGKEKYREQVKKDEDKRLYIERQKEKARLARVAKRALDEAVKVEYESLNRSNWKFKPLDKSSSEYKSIRSSLIHQATLTPEQRTLRAFQESGVIRSDATIATLKPEERATLDRNKEYFSDDRFTYVTQYKNYVNSLDEGEIPQL